MKNRSLYWKKPGLFVLALYMISHAATGATIEFAELPEVYPVSSGFKVFIDSVEIPVSEFIVYDEVQCHYAQVDFEGSVTIRVITNESIVQHQIRPLRHGIMPTIEDTLLEHELDKPEFLAYNINDKEILFLLARPLETHIPGPESDSVMNILNSGVDPTGATDETEKILTAIRQAAESDKILFFPKGIYKVKQLDISKIDGLKIYMAPGAVLRGTGKGSDFQGWSPQLKPGDREIDHFIHITDSKNISISGRGTIDPRGMEVHKDLNGGEPLYEAKQATMKIRGLTTESSQNVYLEGILARGSSSQSAPSKGCDNVHISHSITLNYLYVKNTGGFNLWGCTNSSVEDCFYYGGDDGYSAKAPEGYACHHLNFENSVIFTRTRGITFGMQGEEDMHSVVFRNIDVISTRDGIDFKHNWGQGKWSDILVENITVDEIIMEKDAYGNPINLQVQRGGSIKDVTIRNVIIRDQGTPGGIYGHHVEENSPGYISQIHFENVSVGGTPWTDLESSRLTLDDYADASTIYFNGIPVRPVQVKNIAVSRSSVLAQNFPNPFSHSTVISYDLETDSMVQLTVYDLLGRKIETMVQENQNAGDYSVSFDAHELAGGIYLYELKTDSMKQCRKMWLRRL